MGFGLAVSFLLLLLASITTHSQGADPDQTKTPAFGKWQGFEPGTYIIEKQTYRGATYHADGVEYRKTVLAGVGESGAAELQDYTSAAIGGPWELADAHGEAVPGELGEFLESREAGEENVSIGAQTFRCKVTVMTETDDEGKLTKKQWIDKPLGVVLREEEHYEGQDPQGRPSQWSAHRLTISLEKRRVGKLEVDCFVQERQEPAEFGGLWRRTWVAPKIPGRQVKMLITESRDTPAEMESELVEWGRDVSLLVAMKEASPHFSNWRMQKEREAEKRRFEQLQKEMIADLASPDVAKILAGLQSIMQWAEHLAPAIKTAAIEALTPALEHSAVEVRRQAALALGKLGVRGLSLRLGEMMRQDPAGAGQYLEALGWQADKDAYPRFSRPCRTPMKHTGWRPYPRFVSSSPATLAKRWKRRSPIHPRESN